MTDVRISITCDDTGIDIEERNHADFARALGIAVLRAIDAYTDKSGRERTIRSVAERMGVKVEWIE